MSIVNARRKISTNLLVLFVTCVLVFLSAEATVRVLQYRAYGVTLREAERKGMLGGSDISRSLRSNMEVSLRDIIKVNRDPRIIYDLLPNLKAYYAGQEVRTNSVGFRDREYEPVKTDSFKRIVGIGDSVMFGQAVAQGDDYLALLEDILNKWGEGWEVINTAVPGYNTALEVQTLRQKGLGYGPGLVIVGFVSNDVCLPNFIRMETHFLDLGRSFLLDFITGRLARIEPNRFGILDMDLGNFRKCDVREVPPEYAGMVGFGAVEDAFSELRALSRKNGFEVLVFFISPEMEPTSTEAAELAKRMGFNVLSLKGDLGKYMEENGIEDYGSSTLVVKRDGHPSKTVHRIAAGAIFGYLDSSGLLMRLNDRTH